MSTEEVVQFATGLWLFLFGLSFLFHASFWGPRLKKIASGDEQLFTLLLVLVVLGSVMVGTHNLWVADWRVLVTATGWAILVKGGVLLLAPGLHAAYERFSETQVVSIARVGGAVWSVGGGIITYFSLMG
jgi:hypothetical protein